MRASRERRAPFALSLPAGGWMRCRTPLPVGTGQDQVWAEQQGNKVVHAGGQRADRITLTEGGDGIDFMELLAERMCAKFCCI